MKTNEYQITDFEMEFEQANTIHALQKLLKRMKMQRVKWKAGATQDSSLPVIALLDEQMDLVEWELNNLRQAQSRGRFRAYYAFLKMLDEHIPYKTPLIRYKYILDDGAKELKKEILSNMLHLLPEERNPYLVRIKYEMEELLKNVYVQDSVMQAWCEKYHTTEQELFSTQAAKHDNVVYQLLSSVGVAVSEADRLREEAMAVEEEDAYEMNNDLYNVFYGRAVRELVDFVNGQIEQYSQKKATAQDHSAEEIEISRFEELFLAKNDSEPYLQLLRDSLPQVIDDANNFCLGPRSKGAIVAWVDAMKDKNKIWKGISDTTMAAVLNNKIAGLNITDRTIRSAQTKLSKNYKKFYGQF